MGVRADRLSDVLKVEHELLARDRSLADLSNNLDSWLSGRSSLLAMQDKLARIKVELGRRSGLPRATDLLVVGAENDILGSMGSFTRSTQPDTESQRELFRRINDATYKRNRALGLWRSENNRYLLGRGAGSKEWRFLRWEASWLEVWKEEAELTYSLQKAYLKAGGGRQAYSGGEVRKVLALRARAELIGATSTLEPLQSLALKRLTLLARTAQQLDRLTQEAEGGAVVRLRRLSEEQTKLSFELQTQRLQALHRLALKIGS